MRLENVDGCMFGTVIQFIETEFCGRYKCAVFQMEATDFQEATYRGRQFLVIVLAPCLRLPFDEWANRLGALVQPRKPHALTCADVPQISPDY